MTDLLPCPFCGGNPYLHGPDNPGHEYWVTCQSCQAGSKLHSNFDGTKAAWNTRVAPAARASSGWKLVPIEPTPEMHDAGYAKSLGPPEPMHPDFVKLNAAIYRAMIAAAIPPAQSFDKSAEWTVADDYKSTLEAVDHTLTVHRHIDAHTPLHDRIQRTLAVTREEARTENGIGLRAVLPRRATGRPACVPVGRRSQEVLPHDRAVERGLCRPAQGEEDGGSREDNMSRNLIEHPITMDEVWRTMQEACRRQHESGAIGDQQGYILTRITDLVEERFTVEDFRLWR